MVKKVTARGWGADLVLASSSRPTEDTRMDAERSRHVMLVGLEVTDEDSYAKYRAAMTPILAAMGGQFGCDFQVAKVLRGEPRINRVFTISFPDRQTRERFFADAEYQAARERFYAPAVASATILAEFGD